jgi:hypothetical protein
MAKKEVKKGNKKVLKGSKKVDDAKLMVRLSA